MKQFLLFSFFLLTGMMASSQIDGDYRSRADGNWNSSSTWQKRVSGSWVNATDYPGQSTGAGTVTILGNDDVVITASVPNAIAVLVVGDGSGTNETLEFDDNAVINFTVSGNVTFNDGNLLINNAAGTKTHNFNVGGDFTVGSTSSLTTINGTDQINVILNGSGDQSMSGTITTISLQNLTINKSAGTATLSTNVAVAGTMTFTDGELTTSAASLLTIGNTATVSGASDASFVNGPVRKTGSADFTFPVGKTGSGYHPIGLATISASDNFTAEYMRASASSLGGKDQSTPFAVSNISNCEYWNLTKTGSATADVTIGWTASSPCGSGAYVTTIAGLAVSSFNAMTVNKWAFAGEATNQPGSVVAGSTATTGNITKTGVARFTSFALATIPTAGAGNPLPVVFANVKAYSKGTGVQLDWSNMTETDVLNYVVERSSNGVDFTAVASVIAKQNDGGKADYGFYDATPAAVNYYRIQSLEGNNSKKYSVIVKVDTKATKADVVLYPNPVTGNTLSLQATALDKGQYTVRVMSVNGQQVYTKSMTHAGGAVTSSIELPSTVKPGMYTLQIAGGSTVINKSFIVR